MAEFADTGSVSTGVFQIFGVFQILSAGSMVQAPMEGACAYIPPESSSVSKEVRIKVRDNEGSRKHPPLCNSTSTSAVGVCPYVIARVRPSYLRQ